MSGGESKIQTPLRLQFTVGTLLYSVSLSEDGSRIVSGSGDKTVRVWDAVSGECVLGPLEGHTSGVRSVSFSGDKIVSGSWDKTVRVWELNPNGKYECKHILQGHTREVSSVSFCGDGSRIVSGSYDNTVRVWEPWRPDLIALLIEISDITSVRDQAKGKTYKTLQVVNFNQYDDALLSYKDTLLNLKHIKKEEGTLTGITVLGKKYVRVLNAVVENKEKEEVPVKPAAKRAKTLKLRF